MQEQQPTLDDYIRALVDWVQKNPTLIFIVALFLLAATFFNSVVYTVDRDEQAVITQFGAFDRVEGPGLQFKLPPPIEREFRVNTLKVFEKEFGFRTQQTGVQSRRDTRGYEEEAFMLTGDLGIARVEWVVQYRRAQPQNYVFNVQNEERLIRDASEEAVRRIVGDYAATDVITVARVEIAREVKRELQSIMNKYHAGIVIDDLLIQQTEPPDPVAPAFKEVDSARQDRERLRLEAEAVKEQVIPEARGKAERIVAEARGNAERFLEVLREYQQFPEVTRNRLLLERMEKVLDNSERVFVIDKEVKSVLPMMDIQGGSVISE